MRPLARRLAAMNADGARRPWPDAPVPASLVITELDVGGAEKALVTLATGLDRRRWAPTVIALGPEAPLASPLRDAGVPVVCLGISPRRPARALSALAGALRKSEPALVQSFLFHANVATRLAVRAGWPLGGGPWVLGGHRVAERGKRWHMRLERLTSRLCAGSVCVSEGVRRFAGEVGGWPDDRLTVIPNAVDPTRFDRPNVGPIAGLERASDWPFLILYLGRLAPQKGLPILLEAISRLNGAHLAVAGDGPDREALRALADANPLLADRVHWLGKRDDAPALIQAADLLVLPSLWEGMPNAVLEAMAGRRAVVATAVEGTEDLVTPGATGWLAPPGDPDALAAALRDAVSDRARLKQFGEAGRAVVEARFAPARMVAAYESLWAGVLGYEWLDARA